MKRTIDADEPAKDILDGPTDRADMDLEHDMSQDQAFELEARVGIREYANPAGKGFRAILKQRYSDFIVNEIDMQGNVVHLTDLDAPAVELPDSGCVLSEEEILHQLKDLIGEQNVSLLLEYLESSSEQSANKSFSILTPTFEEKEKRSLVHKLFKTAFEGKFDTATEPDSSIRIRPMKTGLNHRSRERVKLPGKFTKFVLYKENRETFDAIQAIAKVLQQVFQTSDLFTIDDSVNPRLFSFAGTKDRRGVTAQLMTAQSMPASKLVYANARLSGKNMIRLGNFEYTGQPLKLGDLKGNRFCITLRDITGALEGEINESLIHLKRNGFINYFGMQRFGNSTSVSTQAVGKQLILGNWKEAVHLLLDPRDDDPEGSILTARTAWKNGDLKAALDGLPSSCTSERALLRYFLKQESGNIRNFSNALSQIPRNLRLMYVHAYQSYVWNMAASERIRRQGIAVLPGDLVVVASVDESKIGKDKIVIVKTREEAEQYTLQDVVLPMPGYDVLYPENESGEYIKELMKSDGLYESIHEQTKGDYSLFGGYRHLMGSVDDLVWKFVSYTDVNVPLTETDWNKLNGEKIDQIQELGADRSALVLSFSLAPSQYATMALREIMKMPTLSRYQALLNN